MDWRQLCLLFLRPRELRVEADLLPASALLTMEWPWAILLVLLMAWGHES